MDYFRLYIGDYLADTQTLSLAEDGAYGRLLKFYYASERPLPVSLAEVYKIARATTAAERKAVARVLELHFNLAVDGYHNTRADKELSIAVPKIEKMREVARTNGRLSHGPRKKPKSEPESDPISEPKSEPELVHTRASGATAIRQPPTENLSSEKRYHGRDGTGEAAADFGAAALKNLAPPGPEADVRKADDAPAGLLAAVCQRNGITANAFHPLVVDWARDGVTVDRLKAAIATARMPQRKGDGQVPLAYLDPILRDQAASKPKSASWKSDDAAAEALCRELGIKGAKQGEMREAWHARIDAALAEQSRRKVA